MLCDAFCSHTALPRVKGVHQPRENAILSLKTNNHSSSNNNPPIKRPLSPRPYNAAAPKGPAF